MQVRGERQRQRSVFVGELHVVQVESGSRERNILADGLLLTVQEKHEGSVIAEQRDEIGDDDIGGDCAVVIGDIDYPPARDEVHESLGEATPYDQRRAIELSGCQLQADDGPELAVTTEHAIPDEVGGLVASSVQTTSGSVSESRLIVPDRPRTWTRRRDRSTAVTSDHGITGYLRPTSLRTATTT